MKISGDQAIILFVVMAIKLQHTECINIFILA